MKKPLFSLFLLPILAVAAPAAVADEGPTTAAGRSELCPTDALGGMVAASNALARAEALREEGNVAEALDAFRAALTDPEGAAGLSTEAFGAHVRSAILCLEALGREAECEAFLDEILAAHPFRPKMQRDQVEEGCEFRVEGLEAAPPRIAVAGAFLSLPHHGSFVGGTFVRGSWNGRSGNCAERDRVRALRILDELRPWADAMDKGARAALFGALETALRNGRTFGGAAWRLQERTDLSALPEIDEPVVFPFDGGGGAPVGPDGKPVFHALPESWDAAATDGERWRWALARLGADDPAEEARRLGAFARDQFGAQTLRDHEAAALDLPSLADDETAARLATGPARFRLPDDYNPIVLAERAGKTPDWYELGRWFESRMQFDRAVEAYRRMGDAQAPLREHHLKAVLGPWVGVEVERWGHTPEEAPWFDLRFRNAKAASFELRPVDEAAIARGVDALVRAWPTNRVEWWETRIDPSMRLVRDGGTNLLGAPVAAWSTALDPDPRHFDRTVRVRAPAPLPAGAYLLRASAEGGNSVHALIRVADTALLSPAPVVRPGDERGMAPVVVADAVDGHPIAGADVSLLRWTRSDSARTCLFKDFRATTDANGAAMVPCLYNGDGSPWWAEADLCVVTNAEGRRVFAQGAIHYGDLPRSDAPREWAKPFLITDRPAYRPGAKVRYKLWVERAEYGQDAGARWAGKRIGVVILDPKGDEIWDKTYTADESGGLDGEMPVAADAPLGVYRVEARVPGQGRVHAGTFRVEEYRKPEFEVAVETPGGPLELGAKAKAVIRASYLFGAPVAGGTAKVSVTRMTDEADWFPEGRWDWLYGRGYGLCAYDWDWHPLWRTCLVRAPWCEWSEVQRPWSRPETVANLVVPLREDGTAEVEWDTATAKALYGEDADHRYVVRVSVTDAARRTIDAEGSVLATAHPFRVRAWALRPWWRDDDAIELRARVTGAFSAPAAPAGALEAVLHRVDPATGRETEVGPIGAPRPDPDAPAGAAAALWRIPAPARGQYRLAVRATDAGGRAEESSVFFTVLSAAGDPARDLRFAPLELVPDKAEYAPGETARLALHADRADSWVLVVVRAGTDRADPRWVHLDGKTAEVTVAIDETDRPNFFVEALAFHDGRLRREMRQIVVPPAGKEATVEVEAPERLAPGDEAEVTVRVKGPDGAPAPEAAVALAVYDRAVDQVAGGSNVRPILSFFWGWLNLYHSWYGHSLLGNASLLFGGDEPMLVLGQGWDTALLCGDNGLGLSIRGGFAAAAPASAPAMARSMMSGFVLADASFAEAEDACVDSFGGGFDSDADGMACAYEEMAAGVAAPVVSVRTAFADTAFWGPRLRPTGEPGVFRARFTMPEDATGWRARAWAMLPGACVGEGEARLATAKDLLVSPALPRFLVQGDEATLSAVVHNRTDKPLDVIVSLAETNGVLDVSVGGPERDGGEGRAPGGVQRISVPARGSARADFVAYALREGEAAIVATAVVPGGGRSRADGVARAFPVKRRGFLKVEPFSRVAAPGEGRVEIRFRVPEKRDPETTSLTVRADDSLLPALWAAVPWLIEYPHGCTEQTLNRFVPAVLVRKALRDAGMTLEAVAAGGAATNAPPRPGAPVARRAPATDRTPVLTDAELDRIVEAGVKRLGEMQLSDGGWGWFSGWGERSAPHTTATVVHGLLAARAAGVAVPEGMVARGLDWLKGEQARRRDEIAKDRKNLRANAEDALVARVLAEGGAPADKAMLGYLHEDRAGLPLYAKALLGLAFDALGDARRDDLVRNLRQFLVEDPEDRTARFELGNAGWWWHWYGSDVESQAAGLELLLRAAPDDPAATGLARHLAIHRAHGTYWNSTRDTACALEALLLHHRLREAGEAGAGGAAAAGRGRLRLVLDGKPLDLPVFAGETVAIPSELLGAGEHALVVEAEEKSRPLYVAATLRAFTFESRIGEAGLEVKVRRTVSRLVEREKETAGRDAAGGVVARRTVEHDRVPLGERDEVAPGDLVEVRLDVEAKNDFEYVLVEDARAAGFEAVEALSGYRWEGDLFPYVEWRDDRACLYLSRLPRGAHSLTYRLRAETPGAFTALPARAEGMYDPDDLCGNSASLRLGVADER